LDRKCIDGGWNFGNPVMLGKALPATPQETCLALLALKVTGVAESHPAVAAGLHFLAEGAASSSNSASGAAWHLFGLKTWDKEPPGLRETIVSGQLATGSWAGSPFVTAAAILSLNPAALAARRQP
jgi:hypothetical protein